MNKEKQIEEMAVEFAKINCNPKGCYNCNLCDEYGSLELNCEDYLYYRNSMAETFYNAGYRKASDVAEEMLEIIEAVREEFLPTEYHRGYNDALDDFKKAIERKRMEDVNPIYKHYTDAGATHITSEPIESENDK